MSDDEKATLLARLAVLEAMMVMTVGHRYVDRGPAGLHAVQQDVSRWFGTLVADAKPALRPAIQAQSARMLSEIVGGVAMRLARRRAA